MLASAVLSLGAAAAFAAGPVPMNECLRLGAGATQVAPGKHDVRIALAWTCDPALVGAGIVKLRVNGEPVSDALAYDGAAPLIHQTTVADAVLPLKVCATLAGFDTNGDPTVMADQCVHAVLVGTSTAPEPVAPGKPGRRAGQGRR